MSKEINIVEKMENLDKTLTTEEIAILLAIRAEKAGFEPIFEEIRKPLIDCSNIYVCTETALPIQTVLNFTKRKSHNFQFKTFMPLLIEFLRLKRNPLPASHYGLKRPRKD